MTKIIVYPGNIMDIVVEGELKRGIWTSASLKHLIHRDDVELEFELPVELTEIELHELYDDNGEYEGVDYYRNTITMGNGREYYEDVDFNHIKRYKQRKSAIKRAKKEVRKNDYILQADL